MIGIADSLRPFAADLWRGIGAEMWRLFDPRAFHIDTESHIAEWAADGMLGRIRRDDCEAAWVDIGGES